MASRTLITIGTDGVTDWVRTPDGSRWNLGPVSVLNFVHKLSKNTRAAKTALDTFLRDGEAMLQVIEDHMWDLLAPRRARWASDGSFIDPDQGTGLSARTRTMNTPFENDLDALEQHIAALDKAAASGVSAPKMAEGCQILSKLAGKLQTSDQLKTASYFGFDAPEPVEVTPAPPEGQVGTPAEVGGHVHLAYDTYSANSDLASSILDTAEEVNAKIDAVATRPGFNASRAKADLHEVTSKVASIMRDVDLTTSWVQADLQKLSARANELRDLFASVQV